MATIPNHPGRWTWGTPPTTPTPSPLSIQWVHQKLNGSDLGCTSASPFQCHFAGLQEERKNMLCTLNKFVISLWSSLPKTNLIQMRLQSSELILKAQKISQWLSHLRWQTSARSLLLASEVCKRDECISSSRWLSDGTEVDWNSSNYSDQERATHFHP